MIVHISVSVLFLPYILLIIYSLDINVAVLDKSTSCVIFYILQDNDLTPIKIIDYKPENPEVDVLRVKFSPQTKEIYYVATQESIIMYDQRMALQIVETFKGNT